MSSENLRRFVLFLTLLLPLSLAACGESRTASPQVREWPIAAEVYTTAEEQIHPVALAAGTPQVNPREVALYGPFGYSAWQRGAGTNYSLDPAVVSPYDRRTDLAPGYAGVPAARLLSFFAISDVHITDKESPAQPLYPFWIKPFGPASAGMSSGYSPVILSTTQVLDAAVRTINALHAKRPFDFGISLGDTINNAQYNELRWYLDVLDGKVITPSSGGHLGAATIDYQMPFKAAGLNRAIPWYQVMGNHDQFWSGSVYEFDKTLAAHVGSVPLDMDADYPGNPQFYKGSGFYMGVIDGTTPYGDLVAAGPVALFPAPPAVIPDPDRRSLATGASPTLNYMREFFLTASNPAGHGFTQESLDNDFASYSFLPRPDLPLKVIVLDDTCKGETQPNYALACLDQPRLDWLKDELQKGQDEKQLMIIAAHIPLNPQISFANAANFSFFRTPGFTEATLLPVLHSYPNLILWMSGHRHVNVVTPQPYDPATPGQGPENSFWEVETASLRDFPQQFRTFEIRRNSDHSVSIVITNVDPAVAAGTPAAKSRGYAVGAARIFGATDAILADTSSRAYNAELVKKLTPEMQAVIAPLGVPIP